MLGLARGDQSGWGNSLGFVSPWPFYSGQAGVTAQMGLGTLSRATVEPRGQEGIDGLWVASPSLSGE